jgi:hypothetical protein
MAELSDLVAPSEGLECDRAAKNDVLVEECGEALKILGHDGSPELFHWELPFPGSCRG